MLLSRKKRFMTQTPHRKFFTQHTILNNIKKTNGNFLLTQTGNIIPKNEGNVGTDTSIIYQVLIASMIGLITVGFIPGTSTIFNEISSRLGLLSIILLVVSTYVNTISVEKSNEIATVSQTFSIVDRCRTNLISMLSSFSTSCPRFINSLYYDFQKTNSTLLFEDPNIPDNYQSINVICTTLYQNVEDYLNTTDYTWIDAPQILCHFASMFLSKQVQEHWQKNYALVWYITAQQINNLIRVVNTYTFKNSYELETFFIFYSSGNEFTNLLGR